MVNIKDRLRFIIFGTETPEGKAFDIVLIISILLSVLIVMLDSVKSLQNEYGHWFLTAEWVFTVLFSVEYLFRLSLVKKPMEYAFSFFGIIDFLAIIPSYLSLFLPGAQFLIIIRVIRVLRIFRVLKLIQYVGEAEQLAAALRSSRRKIVVFFFTVLILMIIFGSLIYLIEGEENGFTSIPRSIYWAIVTMTTVGYGDISPRTNLGQALAALVMIIGYSVIAVPTGIVSAEMSQHFGRKNPFRLCPGCGEEGADEDAHFCKYCGTELKGSNETNSSEFN